MTDILQLGFAQNALLSMLFTSVIAGIVGSYIVVRRMVFVAGGITHASFGGIGMAYYLGFNPTAGAIVFAVATALGIDVLNRHGKIREDSAIAMLWSLGMAVGVIFMFLTPGYAPNLMGFMFGDVLSVSHADVAATAMAAIMVTALATIFYRPLLYVAYDASFAKISGWPTGLISATASALTALSIVLTIKSVGIILVLSVFTIPQAIAGLYVRHLWQLMLLSSLIALAGCLCGLLLSFSLDLPAGAMITALLSASLLIIKLIRS